MSTRRFTSTGQVIESVPDQFLAGKDEVRVDPIAMFQQYQASCLELNAAFWRATLAFFAPAPPRRQSSSRVVAHRRFVIPC